MFVDHIYIKIILIYVNSICIMILMIAQNNWNRTWVVVSTNAFALCATQINLQTDKIWRVVHAQRVVNINLICSERFDFKNWPVNLCIEENQISDLRLHIVGHF